MFKTTDPEIAVSHTGEPDTFAYTTALKRWVPIINSIATDVQSSATAKDSESASKIVESLNRLKECVVNNAPVEPLQESTEIGSQYNEEMEQLRVKYGTLEWRNGPWLFTECLLYRKIHFFFAEHAEWKDYDPFRATKRRAFESSIENALKLTDGFFLSLKPFESQSFEDLHNADPEKNKELFIEVMLLSLWGNGSDLSLMPNATDEDLQRVQAKRSLEASLKRIVDNDFDELYASLRLSAPKNGQYKQIDIVLDNSGFELYSDMLLAVYLIESKLVDQVTLHPKDIPWFVSDTLPADIVELIDMLDIAVANSSLDVKLCEAGKRLSALLKSYLKDDKLKIKKHSFWTTAHPIGRIFQYGQDLANYFYDTSDLVIFKGDLNYRKLTYDGKWARTVTFKEAIGPLATDDKRFPILSLRTCKADVCVGLSEDRALELSKEPEWTYDGSYAVVSFNAV
ncbi:hypothetical protein CANCADRAFT_133621 [Tortispora caseinolytica NRRL Y-17796]|uniref:Sugar phosphate phosphatase n=1 Tax=Tortispora caseinolytica NRRL Y-17796 TaxID=767744 RepID=A0A1E4TBH6_9ASCO|nr:hypothetical protein CANCADRAFT_133621 [Tortispora caseinolytica NRRL Y-17796]